MMEQEPPSGAGSVRAAASDSQSDEQAARAGIDRFRQIADSLDLVFWVVELGPVDLVSYVSPAFERIWGHAAQAIYDIPRLWVEAVHEEDRPAVIAAFDGWRDDPRGRSYQIDFRIVRPDGAQRWISDRGRCWFDDQGRAYRLTGVAEDITERKRAELQARDGRRHLETLIEALPQSVWTNLPDGRCDYRSPHWRAYAGTGDDEDDAAPPWMACLHPADSARVRSEWQSALRDARDCELQLRLRRQDGVYRWFRLRAIPMRGEDGRLQRWFGTCGDIDDLKHAEAALRDERERLDRIVQTAPGIVHTYRRTADGRTSVPYGSERIAALFELPAEAVRRDASLLGRRIERATREQLGSTMADSARRMQPWFAHFRIATPTRGEIWLEVHAMPVLDGDGSINWHGSLTDITRRKAAEQALFESQAQLQTLFDHLEDGLITMTPDGRMLQWNAGALRLHGLRGDEFVERVMSPVFDVYELHTLAGEFVARDDWPVPRIQRGESLRDAEFRVSHREQGWERVLSYSGAVVRGADGQPILSMVQIRDTTEQRRKDDELRQLTQRLEERVRERTIELEAANRELEAFSYSVSHDLRAPLRAMEGFSQMLQRDFAPRLDREGQRYVGIIRDSARRMSQLIDDLLAFARLSRQPLVKRRVPMQGLVREVIRQLQSMQPERAVTWEVGELPDGEGDLAMLRQVWINLLSNALKYSRPRERALIRIGAFEGEGGLEYRVHDNGIGFDMANADKLFGVFERLHRDDEFEGNGVGLALVQRIVQRHGGQVHAESTPGEGATFGFTLGERRGLPPRR